MNSFPRFFRPRVVCVEILNNGLTEALFSSNEVSVFYEVWDTSTE